MWDAKERETTETKEEIEWEERKMMKAEKMIMTNEKMKYSRERERLRSEKQEENPALITVMAQTHRKTFRNGITATADAPWISSSSFFFYSTYKLFINKQWIEYTYWVIIHTLPHSFRRVIYRARITLVHCIAMRTCTSIRVVVYTLKWERDVDVDDDDE